MTKKPAFTLVELLVAITIFVIFISFGMLSFSVFHRTQIDAALSREMMFELNQTMNILTEAIKENKIDYEYYKDCNESIFVICAPNIFNQSDSINKNILALLSSDGETRTVFKWEKSDETLQLQKFEKNDVGEFVEADGYSEPLILNGEQISVVSADFRIFPAKDPYDSENFADAIFYQPNVKIKLTFSTPGTARQNITIDLQTTVTSRVYQ